jgi:hypothetical protein
MQARYYDPVIGRFYSNDPVDAVSHLNNAEGIKGFNRYSYAVNNPYKYVDPDGKAVFYAGFTGGANAGVSGAGAGGFFLDVSSSGIVFGTYQSGEVGSSTTLPGAELGFEMGGSTGGHESVLNGPYMVAGAEAVAGIGGSAAITTTLSDNPEVGIQITVETGTPQLGGHLHTGGGTSQEIASVSTQEIKGVASQFNKILKTVNETLGLTKSEK